MSGIHRHSHTELQLHAIRSAITEHRLPLKYLLQPKDVNNICKGKKKYIYVLAPQKYTNVEKLTKKHSMFQTSKHPKGFVSPTLFYSFIPFQTSTKLAVSGSGSDVWVIWNSDVLHWIDQQLKSFAILTYYPASVKNPIVQLRKHAQKNQIHIYGIQSSWPHPELGLNHVDAHIAAPSKTSVRNWIQSISSKMTKTSIERLERIERT